MIVTANSAHSILLRHNLTESGVYYLCNVTEVKGEENKPVNNRVTKEIMNVTGLLPDTTYRVDCVAYRSDGVEACVEANTTVTTRELHLNLSLLIENVVHNVCVLQVQTEYTISQSEAAVFNPYIAMVAMQLFKTSLGMHHQTTTTFNAISSSTSCKASPPAVRPGPAAMQHKPHSCF